MKNHVEICVRPFKACIAAMIIRRPSMMLNCTAWIQVEETYPFWNSELAYVRRQDVAVVMCSSPDVARRRQNDNFVAFKTHDHVLHLMGKDKQESSGRSIAES